MFCLQLEELGQLRGQEVQIILEDDNLKFRQPYRLSEVERTLVHARTTKLLDAGFVELFKGEYVSSIVMMAKKDILGNWTKRHMCGDYH
jgi:hypothetical protein